MNTAVYSSWQGSLSHPADGEVTSLLICIFFFSSLSPPSAPPATPPSIDNFFTGIYLISKKTLKQDDKALAATIAGGVPFVFALLDIQ